MEKGNNKSVAKRSKLLLLIGFAFFINPVPLGLDFIPDAFGCLLVYFGLTQLAFFDGEIEKAKKNIFYLFIVEAVRLFMTESVVSTEIGSNRMLAVTTFSIIEGIIYIILFKQLFGGISYFSMRNNCNIALSKCDGCAFMSYLSFFVRIAAALLPELLAIMELELEFVTDFETVDSITDIMAAKPFIVILLSLVALITGIAWYISLFGLLRSFFGEAGQELDARYSAEFSSRPEMIRPKTLRNGSFAMYAALFFAIDVAFDGIRIIPASAMFLLLFISTFLLKNLGDFSKTRRVSVPAFLLLLGAEAFKAVFVPNGAVIIYETELWVVAVGAVSALAAIPVCMLCVRYFLTELSGLSVALGGEEIPISGAWISYCITAVLWTAGYVVPYFFSYVSTLRFFAACIFIWQTAKIISHINTEEYERNLLS